MKNDLKAYFYIKKFDAIQNINKFIYFLTRNVIFSHFFHSDLTSEYEAKSGICLTLNTLKFIKNNLIYLFLTLIFIVIFEEKTNSFFFFCYLLVLLYCLILKINRVTLKEYNLIKLFRMNGNKYAKIKIFGSFFSKIIYAILPIIIINKSLKINLFLLCICFLSSICLTILMEYIYLKNVKRNNYIIKKKPILKLLIFISYIICLLLLYKFNYYISNEIMIFIMVITIVLSALISKYINNYNFDKFYKANLNDTFIKGLQISQNNKNVTKVMINNINGNIDKNQTDNNIGYKYLFNMFLKRYHKNISAVTKMSEVIVYIGCIILFLVPYIFKIDNIIDKLFDLNYLLFIIIYFTCSYNSGFLHLCFLEIDRFLVNYNFYRNKQSIKENMFLRLRHMLKKNLFLSFIISLTFLLTYLVYNLKASLVKVIILAIMPLILTIFYTIYYIFIYYIFQPYSFEGTIVNKIYKFLDNIIYFFAFAFYYFEIKLNLLNIGILILFLSIVSIIFYIIILRKGTKSFRVK